MSVFRSGGVVLRSITNLILPLDCLKALRSSKLTNFGIIVRKKTQNLALACCGQSQRSHHCVAQLGSRGKKPLKRLLASLARFKIKRFATDRWNSYKALIPKEKLTQSKKETFSVERTNCRIRHFFARFHRRTLCYTKSIDSLKLSMPLFILYLNHRMST